MTEYWLDRLEHALRSSLTAPTSTIREIHLRTAGHYQSLVLCSVATRSAEQALPLSDER